MIVTRGIGRGGPGSIAAWGFGLSPAAMAVLGPFCITLAIATLYRVEVEIV